MSASNVIHPIDSEDHSKNPDGLTKSQQDLKDVSGIDESKKIDEQNGIERKGDNSVEASQEKTIKVKWWKMTFLGYRVIKQLSLFGSWMCIGLFAEIVGPTLPDLRDRLGVTLEEISRATIGKSVGTLIGAILGGLLHDKFPQKADLINGIAFALAGLATIFVPWMPNIALVGVLLSINGLVEGVVNAGGNVLVFTLWQENAAPFMHLTHFCFGIGAFIAPQIASPFLSPENTTEENSNYTGFSHNEVSAMSENIGFNRTNESRIEYAYLIIGIIILLFSLLLIGIFFKGSPKGFPHRKSPKQNTDMCNPASCAQGSLFMGSAILSCLFLYFLQAVGPEKAMGQFIFTFVVESDLKFSKTQAASVNSVFWLSFSIGRGLGAIIANFVNVKVFTLIDIVGVLLCAIILAIFGGNEATVLWVFTGFIGFFIAGCYPNGMSWANIYLSMNSMAAMVLIVGGCTGQFIYQYFPGFLIQNFGPNTLFYLMVGGSIVTVVIFIIMQFLGHFHGERFDKVEIEDAILEDEWEVDGKGSEHISYTLESKNL